MSINERCCTHLFMVTFSGGLPPPRTPRPCAPRSTAYCLKLTYLTAAIFSSMAPKSANFARKNRIATILCVHHHFPDFRKPSRNIVQIGAEFERKMADLFRKIGTFRSIKWWFSSSPLNSGVSTKHIILSFPKAGQGCPCPSAVMVQIGSRVLPFR